MLINTLSSFDQRPLRVIHIADATERHWPAPPARSSRIVLSGRMADVCAELDRLAELEAQMPAQPLAQVHTNARFGGHMNRHNRAHEHRNPG